MRGILTVAACLVLVTQAFADQTSSAILASIKGGVALDKGQGFAPVTGSASVAAGDRLQLSEHASAVIFYQNRCTRTLGGGQSVTVPDALQCARRMALMPNEEAAIAAATSAGKAPTGLIIGGIVIAAGGAAAIVALGQKNNPASP